MNRSIIPTMEAIRQILLIFGELLYEFDRFCRVTCEVRATGNFPIEESVEKYEIIFVVNKLLDQPEHLMVNMHRDAIVEESIVAYE